MEKRKEDTALRAPCSLYIFLNVLGGIPQGGGLIQ